MRMCYVRAFSPSFLSYDILPICDMWLLILTFGQNGITFALLFFQNKIIVNETYETIAI